MKQSIDQAISQITRRQPLSRALGIVTGLLLLTVLTLPAYAQDPAVTAAVDRTALSLARLWSSALPWRAPAASLRCPPWMISRCWQQQRRADAYRQRRHHDPDGHAVPVAAAAQRRVDHSGLPDRCRRPGRGQHRPHRGQRDPGRRGLTADAAGLRRPAPLFQGGADPFDLFGLLDQMLQQGSGLGSSSGLGQLPVSPSSSLQQIAAPAALQGQDYYAEASVDKTTPYQGEQVLYTLRFYRALDPFGASNTRRRP